MRDPNVLTIPSAAVLIGITTETLRTWLKNDSELRAKIVIESPGYTRISYPRLMRHLHGDEWEKVS